jgi:hypothetical protein
MTVTSRELKALDVFTTIVGAFLFISPWLFGFAAETRPAWDAWVVGAVIALASLVALILAEDWEQWVTLAAAVWGIIAPWVLGFTAQPYAVWTHVIAGIVTALAAAYALWHAHETGGRVTTAWAPAAEGHAGGARPARTRQASRAPHQPTWPLNVEPPTTTSISSRRQRVSKRLPLAGDTNLRERSFCSLSSSS